jgi:hypothetical protein
VGKSHSYSIAYWPVGIGSSTYVEGVSFAEPAWSEGEVQRVVPELTGLHERAWRQIQSGLTPSHRWCVRVHER